MFIFEHLMPEKGYTGLIIFNAGIDWIRAANPPRRYV